MKLLKPLFWHKKSSLLSLVLLPFSVFFQFLIILKKIIKKKEKFKIPIICVGNVYLGGTGKTPLTVKIYEILKKLDKKIVIIKKFYKSHEDEVKLIQSKKIELFKNKSRIEAIKKAEREKFDCVILDDGFQDTSIVRDLNIICFNEKQLAGNEMTLPSGPLREPLSSLKNCQIIVINGNINVSFEKKIKEISKNIKIYYSEYSPSNLDQFTKYDLLAFAGIGNPNNFFNLLEKNNLQILKKISFPDHYNYSVKELQDIVEYSKKHNLKIVTTEKDYYRIEHHKIPQIQYLSIDLKIKNQSEFEKEITKCLL